MQRRRFVQNVALMGVISPFIFSCDDNHNKMTKSIGLQLYTLREELKKDASSVLKQVSAMGYKKIECAGYTNGLFYGYPPQDYKRLLDGLGIEMPSGHCMTGAELSEGTYSMTYNWERYCEDAATVGQKYIVCAYFMESERKNIDDYKKLAHLLNTSAETAKSFGLQFCHHNHDFEFLPLEGSIPYDILLSETSSELVKFELDYYWAVKADVDYTSLINAHIGRFPLWHLKDMENPPNDSFAPVGSGRIDWASIFALRETAGLQHFFVEQDVCIKNTPIESIEMSLEFLNNADFV